MDTTTIRSDMIQELRAEGWSDEDIAAADLTDEAIEADIAGARVSWSALTLADKEAWLASA